MPRPVKAHQITITSPSHRSSGGPDQAIRATHRPSTESVSNTKQVLFFMGLGVIPATATRPHDVGRPGYEKKNRTRGVKFLCSFGSPSTYLDGYSAGNNHFTPSALHHKSRAVFCHFSCPEYGVLGVGLEALERKDLTTAVSLSRRRQVSLPGQQPRPPRLQAISLGRWTHHPLTHAQLDTARALSFPGTSLPSLDNAAARLEAFHPNAHLDVSG